MNFKKIQAEDIIFFQSLADVVVLQDEAAIQRCASDETEDFVCPPDLVVQPGTVAAVSAVMRYCHEQHIPVTPRGAGTGLSGGALPIYGGISLDMQRFNKILHTDLHNFQVTTEPGVITQVLQEHVAGHGLFYPPDPASRGSSFIGGNVAENSGGPKALKYGTVKDYVLNLELVLPTGAIIWTGANVLKNATGYNLTQLVTGSEGTLGVITKIVLKLIPAVKHNLLLLVPFRSAKAACAAVNTIFMAGHTPSALEFMERDAIEWAMRYSDIHAVTLPEDIQAHLLIELDGNNPDQLYADAAAVSDILQPYDTGEILLAGSHEQKQMLWALRRIVGEAVKSHSVYREIDTVVPRAELPVLLKAIKETGRKYGLRSVCYGHAGDGNLHVNVIRGDMSDEAWQQQLPLCTRALFETVAKLGGTISGEHGIGLVQRDYLDIVFSTVQLQLMRDIKKVFDPHGIMNPGKIFL